MGQPTYDVEHTQALLVELHADEADGLALSTQIDAMELEVEQALAADLSLGGVCENIEPNGSEMVMNLEQERMVGIRSCTYLISWRAAFGAPDTPE